MTRQRRATPIASSEPRRALAPAAGQAFRDPTAEWLEPDGLGGYASGCASGVRTRRYHALLVSAVTPPTGRHVLVAGAEAWLETDTGRHALTSHRYDGGIVHPAGAQHIVGFEAEPWPRWRFQLDDGAEVEQEILVPHQGAAVLLRWRLLGRRRVAKLLVRPLLACRDAHALTHENDAFRFGADVSRQRVGWTPYVGLPAIAAYTNGDYRHAPDWYRHFFYTEEHERGLDAVEDLASPGEFAFDLARADAVLAFAGEAGTLDTRALEPMRDAAATEGNAPVAVLAAARSLFLREHGRRARFASRLHRAADAYLVRRGDGMTIVAGYPWFTDWGRDTFIALRGLCLAGNRLDVAGRVLGEWAGTVSEGMLPNCFVDAGDRPEFNSVDASLWYVIAVHEYLEAMKLRRRRVAKVERERLERAVLAILEGYAGGTRYGIRLDSDGLLAAGVPGGQLTWMDARVGDHVVTPRIGKPVEVQALWLNALHVARAFTDGWRELLARGRRSFRERFWNAETGALYDVVDAGHVPGAVDASIRPNMLFAIGGLPVSLLEGSRAASVIDVAEEQLWTPLGLRSLSPRHPDYHAKYEGGPASRDGAYHQGTVWPWLAGAFVEGWVRVRGDTAEARQEARDRFLPPLLAHVDEAGLGHVSEIADGRRPHEPRGCPFQAWSVGELLRLVESVVPEPRSAEPPPREGAETARSEPAPALGVAGPTRAT